MPQVFQPKVLPSSSENVTVMKSFFFCQMFSFLFCSSFSIVNNVYHPFPGENWFSSASNFWGGRAKELQHSPFNTVSSPLRDSEVSASSCRVSNPFVVAWLVTAFFFFSCISGGSWDKSSHEVVEVYPICALCQPAWGWAGGDLSLWLFKASYGRKNVLSYTWWEGNAAFAGLGCCFHLWNYGNIYF